MNSSLSTVDSASGDAGDCTLIFATSQSSVEMNKAGLPNDEAVIGRSPQVQNDSARHVDNNGWLLPNTGTSYLWPVTTIHKLLEV